ncbi:MAG: sulfatase [Rikenellaceae bacterium]
MIKNSTKQLAATLGAVASTLAVGAAETQPNILWLTFEDTSPQFIGCYGDSSAKTPVIDNLAAEGVRFTSAFATASVSSASRFCLFTGIPSTTMGTGHHTSSFPIPSGIELFAHYMREAGYYTANNAKSDYNIAGEKEYIARAWDDSSSEADWRGRRAGQPFFAIYNSMSSHQSRKMTNDWDIYEKSILSKIAPIDRVKESEFELPAFMENSGEVRHHLSRIYNSNYTTDIEFGEWLERLEADGLRDSTIIFCFADNGEAIPRGKGSATGLGFRVPFVVWFPPMYAHLSPWGVSGVVSDELISFEDLATTMLALSGAEIPSQLKGRVMMGEKRSAQREWAYMALDRTDENTDLSRAISDGEHIYIKVFTPYQPHIRWNMPYDISPLATNMRKSLLTGRLKGAQLDIFMPRKSEYLYDLKNDKWEVNNLIDDPALQSKLATMRAELKSYLIENHDVHFIPEYTLMQVSNRIPYELGADGGFLPIERVVETAWLYGEDDLEKQLEALRDPNFLVEYWAAVGLFSQTTELSKNALKEIKKQFFASTYPPAKCTLAAILYKYSDNMTTRNYYADLLHDANPEIVRMALQYLITMPKDKLIALSAEIKNQNIYYGSSKVKNSFYAKNFGNMVLCHTNGGTVSY